MAPERPRAPGGADVKSASPSGDGAGPSVPEIPSFDLLRVEPDGSTVIAGRAPPGSRVEIVDKASGKPLLTTDADETGSFVGVFDRPLAPGDYELKLRSVGKDKTERYSDETATVRVPSDGKGDDLLAMVSKPGEASRIITAPRPKIVKATAQADAAKKAVSQAEVASLTPPGDDAAAAPAERPGTPVQEGKQGRAKLRVDAVEIEGDSMYVAGAAPRGSTVRVYADDKLVGESRATSEGRFVVNGKTSLAPGRHTVRADLIEGSDGKVTMRAAVPFDRPAGGDFAAVAPQVAGAAGGELSDFEKASRAAKDALSQLKRTVEAATPDVGDIETARKNAEDTIAALEKAMRTADAGKSGGSGAGDASDGRVGDALSLIRSLPKLEPGQPLDARQLKDFRARVDAAGKRLATVETAAAAAGGPATVVQPALTKSDNFVIIRRGDTLWQISRRTYGRGVRYTTIYLANSTQIADPNLILPGQVFDVPGQPEKSVDQAIELHRELLRKEGRGH